MRSALEEEHVELLDVYYFLVLFEIIPLWLLIRILRGYRGFKSPNGTQSVWHVLPWLVLPIGALLVWGLVAILSARLSIPKSVENFLPSPWTIASINCVLCVVALVTAISKTKTGQKVHLRGTFVGASIYFLVMWIWVLINPH